MDNKTNGLLFFIFKNITQIETKFGWKSEEILQLLL